MAKRVQFRRGTTAEHSTFVGANGEITIDTTKKAVVVHDGITVGGFPIAPSTIIESHINNVSNPHNVTPAQIGLGNVDNTSDSEKPISVDMQNALDEKANVDDLATIASSIEAKAPIDSPVFLGNPSCGAPTLDEHIANKGYVDNVVSAVTGVSFIGDMVAGANNMVLFTKNGKLYSVVGNGVGYKNHCSGRGLTGTIPTTSFFNAQEIVIANTSGIKKYGGNGYEVAYCLFNNGELYTWGLNSKGACGVGTTAAVPFPVLASTNVVDVYFNKSGWYDISNAALVIKKSDGYVYASGYNGAGAFGLGNTTNYSSFTKLTSLGTDVARLFNFSGTGGCIFAQKTDGTILACGNNAFGQLGTGSTTSITSFTDVTEAWGGVAAGDITYIGGSFAYYTSADYINSSIVMMRTASNLSTSVRTCGHGGNGCLGNGGAANISNPYLIPNSDTVSGVYTNGSPMHVLMLKQSGSLVAWGYNANGQCGNDTTLNVLSPVEVATGVTAVLLDGWDNNTYGTRGFSFIRKADGVYATGYNANGILGVGDTLNKKVFTKVKLPSDVTVDEIAVTNTGAGNFTAFFKYNSVANSEIYASGSNNEMLIFPYTTTTALVPVKLNL